MGAKATVTAGCGGGGGPATSGGVSARCGQGHDARARGRVSLLAWTFSWRLSGAPRLHVSRVTRC
ncbi:hypothetical protein BU14_0048s0002 [Porphyra umbilicalis]|nr:hypothetical protein BU14_0048s0002 [Porphyra umbilicalis]|eukprot:OSX80587.1 hypothetical protein BU14_0048s0002 [Porphyra umbilicalis]